MAGEEYTLTKIIRNGNEYLLPGQGIPKAIFGNGSDGDCVIEYCCETRGNVFMEAKAYNFNNFTICEGVKLRFCGEGVPVIRVKNCFINNGELNLRNPLICLESCFKDQYLDSVIKTCKNGDFVCANNVYNSLMQNLSIEALSNYRAPAGAQTCAYSYCSESGKGGNGGSGGSCGGEPCKGCCACRNSTRYDCGGEGGTSIYSNAFGGGGGGAGYASSGTITSGYAGGNAPGDGIGGNGGTGADTSAGNESAGGGGGGGFGYCKGGDGGTGGTPRGTYAAYNTTHMPGGGGAGGNSILGNGGNGGHSGYYCCGGLRNNGGKGGCSYYGNGGNSGVGGSGWSVTSAGGCSMYGNGGCGATGGCSVFGNGGAGSNGHSIFGNSGGGASSRGINATGSSSVAWQGVYGLGLFAKNINNQGCIYGKGGDACTGSNGAEIYVVYSSGNIGCISHGGGTGGSPSQGYLCTTQI